MSARLAKERFRHLLSPLRDRLLEAQVQLREANAASLAVIVTGVPGAGRSESMSELLEWFDPKFVAVHAHDLRKGRGDRPPFWRHWQDLPAKGRIGLFFGGWYEEWLHGACRGRDANARLTGSRIRALEAMLVKDGVQVLKIHLHVPPGVQRKRLRKLAADELTRWRVTAEDRWLVAHAKRVDAVQERALKATVTKAAPWYRIDGSDPEFRSLAVGERVLWGLRSAVRFQPARDTPAAKKTVRKVALAIKRFSRPLPKERYEQSLLELQSRLAHLSRKRSFLDRGAVIVFEGMDAAGKGGAIRRLVHPLDVRQYKVVPVSAPTAEERLYPYLWRFWRQVPAQGDWAIFDRSWYGRVLVERVRGFAAVPDWSRAFDEINEFEAQLADQGLVIAKFWLDVSPETQLKRFRERDADPLKRFKVDPEDWINRRHWPGYRLAASDMVKRTSTRHAPWTLVDGDDKNSARLTVLRTVIRAIEKATS